MVSEPAGLAGELGGHRRPTNTLNGIYRQGECSDGVFCVRVVPGPVAVGGTYY